jgi:hypothetical protein
MFDSPLSRKPFGELSDRGDSRRRLTTNLTTQWFDEGRRFSDAVVRRARSTEPHKAWTEPDGRVRQVAEAKSEALGGQEEPLRNEEMLR